MIDRRLVFNVDWVLLGATVALCLIGVATIESATHSATNAGLAARQLAFVVAGLLALVLTLFPDYRRLVDRAPVLYAIAVVVLLGVYLFAPTIAHARRWIRAGPVLVQPSEFAKLVLALFLAKVFSDSRKDRLGLSDVAIPGILTAVLILLIAAEPDLGTAAALLVLFTTMAYLAGLRVAALLQIAVICALVAAAYWPFALQYQRDRVQVFLGLKTDPQGKGYQSTQSKIAVGSGSITGRGYKQGPQSQLGYLPERHTDYIFSALAEEMGFVGVAVVLGLYLLILWRALDVARLARDRAGGLLVGGITACLAFSITYNIAMVAAVVPVKGLALPLMSYGGSSMVASLMAVGLILNVRMRRFAN
jgi:rod shape determining protein RodA